MIFLQLFPVLLGLLIQQTQQNSGLRFDGTISLGSIVTSLTFIVLTLFSYRDLTWRVKNLEVWRKEQQDDNEKKEKMIESLREVVRDLKEAVNSLARIETIRGKRDFPGR